MRFDHRLLLTGTPVQNNLMELYSLLCFIAPTIFRYKYVDDFVNTCSDLSASNGLLIDFLSIIIYFWGFFCLDITKCDVDLFTFWYWYFHCHHHHCHHHIIKILQKVTPADTTYYWLISFISVRAFLHFDLVFSLSSFNWLVCTTVFDHMGIKSFAYLFTHCVV